MTKINENHNGFTLLEMMVSISILAIVMVSLFRMESTSVQLASSRKFYSTASLFVRMKLAQTETDLKINGQKEAVSMLSGDFGDDYPGYLWHLTLSNMPDSLLEDLDFLHRTTWDDFTKHLKRIDVEIKFKDQHSFSITTWRFVGAEY